jgi:hypothetical protein
VPPFAGLVPCLDRWQLGVVHPAPVPGRRRTPPSCPLWPGLCAGLGPLDPMKTPTPAVPADPVMLFIAAGWLAVEALAVLLIAALALPCSCQCPLPSPSPAPAPMAPWSG